MAILLPNYLQTGSYSAKKDRRLNSAEVLQEGIVRKGHFAITQRAAGANMSVDVSSGEAWVKGDSAVDQGYYHVVNDATVNATVSAANATNPRIDAVVLAVNDSTEVGGSDSYLLEVIAGTPTAGATLANLKGAPAGVSGPTIGATKLLLGYVLVAAAATSVLTTNMGGLRDPKNYNAEYNLTKAEPYAVAGAPAQYAHGRPLDYVPSARAYGAGGALGANEAIPLATRLWDNDGCWASGTSSRLICNTPGFYLCAAGSLLTTAAGAFFIAMNGTSTANIQNAQYQATANTGVATSGFVRMGYGDYVVCAWNTAGTVAGQPTYSPSMGIVWQGP